MSVRRIIPCLDVKDGRVVKGVQFVELRDAGDPVEQAAAYDRAGADELCFLDITASHERRDIIYDVVDLAKRFQDYGVEAVIYTDIGRDGMMSGVNVEATVRLAQALTVPVIASGGLNSVDDIRKLCAVESEGITGAITGRAIYEGKLDFAEALKVAAGES